VQLNTSATSPLFINFTGLPDGTFFINATVNDTSNNENQTETRTIVLDNVAPAIAYNPPTETAGSFINRDNILVNVTATDVNLFNITIRLFNSTLAQINSSTTSSSPNFINFSGLPDGLFFFNATAFDRAGNNNFTELRNVTIDTVAPEVDEEGTCC